jgi:hypothetical protein
MYVMDEGLRAQDNKPDPVVVTPPLVRQRPGRVIKEEEPLQLSPRRLTRKPAVRRRLLIAQELNRHNP